jgi:hypothetical protein
VANRHALKLGTEVVMAETQTTSDPKSSFRIVPDTQAAIWGWQMRRVVRRLLRQPLTEIEHTLDESERLCAGCLQERDATHEVIGEIPRERWRITTTR